MIKIIKVYKNLQDVVIVEEDGKIGFYCMQEDPALDTFEEGDIIKKLELAFKIKLEK